MQKKYSVILPGFSFGHFFEQSQEMHIDKQ